MKNKKLSAKRERFCREYVIDFNKTQAAIRAGYSPKTAYSQGQRLLKNVEITKYIAELKKKASGKLEITHQDVLKKLKKWVESDITEVLGLDLDEIKALPIEVKNLITEVKHTRKSYMMGEAPVTEDFFHFKFVSKEKGQDMINKHLGFYEVDNRQKASTNITMVEIPNNGRSSNN